MHAKLLSSRHQKKKIMALFRLWPGLTAAAAGTAAAAFCAES
jgi:hypothetical protein